MEQLLISRQPHKGFGTRVTTTYTLEAIGWRLAATRITSASRPLAGADPAAPRTTPVVNRTGQT
jgi:hypothetical protein